MSKVGAKFYGGERILLAYFLQGLLLGGTAAAQPGPFQAYLLAQTLKNGWRRTLWAAFAPLISDGPIVALVLLVLTTMPPWLEQGLRLIGGLFLLYLAWRAYVAAKTAVSLDPSPATASQQSILEAALMNFLSPNPYLFWATIAGPILLTGWRQSPWVGLSFVLGFYGALIGGFMAFVLLFGVAGRLDARLNRVLGWLSALLLLGFGLYQIWLGWPF